MTSTTTTTSSSAASSTLNIVPFTIVASGTQQVKLEVKPDGSVVTEKGEPWAKISGDSIWLDGAPAPAWVVSADNSVISSFFKTAKLSFDSGDRLTIETSKGKSFASVDDAGAVTYDDGNGKKESPWKVVGMTPDAKRTAVLVSILIPRQKGH